MPGSRPRGWRLFVGIGISALGIGSARAQTNVGTTAAPFLTMDVGARAVGMGGAFAAVADDATALFWNPAGLPRVEGAALHLQHARWLADVRFQYAAFATSTASGAFGVSLTLLDYGELAVTTVEAPEGTGERFTPRDLAAGVAYGQELTDRFSIGGQVKYVQQTIWHESASGWAADIGTIYRFEWRNLTIGSAVSNFGTRMRMDGLDLQVEYDPDERIDGNNGHIPADLKTARWNLPVHFRAGLAIDLLQSARLPTRLAVDAVHPNDNTESVNLGVETSLSDILSLRGGFSHMFQEDAEGGLRLGVGLKTAISQVGSLRADFAFAELGRLGTTLFYSVELHF